jgi:hypothetical protein
LLLLLGGFGVCNTNVKKKFERLRTSWREFLFFLGFGVFWNYGKVVRVFLEGIKENK